LHAVLPFVDDRLENDLATDAALDARFFKIGGVPRFVFASQGAFDAAVGKILDGLSKLSSFDFHGLLEKDKDWGKIPDYAFTLHSRPPLYNSRSTVVALASAFAAQELPKYMNEVHFRQLTAIASATRNLSTAMFSTAEGYAWQVACQYRLTR